MEKELELRDYINRLSELYGEVALKGDEAILLWLKGKDAWNKWVEENPEVEVFFTGVEFSYEALKERFPGNDNVERLRETPFRLNKELVCFSEYNFGGNVYFCNVTFSSPVCFSDAAFNSHVYFSNVTFGTTASFQNATFGGSTLFQKVIFNDFTNFRETISCDNLNFNMVTFRDEVTFHNVTLNGCVFINTVTFSGPVLFSGAVFSSKVDFIRSAFGDFVTFVGAVFQSEFMFDVKNAERLTSLDFKGAVFEKRFLISGSFGCIPDLRQIKTNLHVDLSKLRVHLVRTREKYVAFQKKAVDLDDAERLCRLKEIADENKNHKRALAFHADEQRANRWGELSSLQSVLDIFYSATSNYGQSILRPFVWLAFCITLFAVYAVNKSNNDSLGAVDKYTLATELSIATVTPFLSVSKSAREDGMKLLYQDKRIRWFNLLSYLHSFFSFIFIFLIGLGLRNRFRI